MIEPQHLLAAVIAIVGMGGGALWALFTLFKGEFSRIGDQFAATRAEGEARAVKTHGRIDELRTHIDEKCVSKEVHAADMRRLDDGFVERDQIINSLAGRLECPARRVS